MKSVVKSVAKPAAITAPKPFALKPTALKASALKPVVLKSGVLIFIWLLSFATATDYPYTVTDDLGFEVTLTAEPERVVAMIPSHTETLCAINACDKLVGVDEYSNFPGRVNKIPKLGSAFSPNLEAIVALQPDLVLTDESSDLAQALRRVGVPVYVGTAQTFDEVFDKFEVLGALVDRETEAALLSGRVEGGVRAISERAGTLEPTTVYYEIDATPYSVGPNSFIGVLLSRAGGKNIVTEDLGDFPQLDPEYIVAADPAVIIVSERDADALPGRSGWAGITAVRNGRVIPTDATLDDAISRPGPRLVEAVQFFARALHPEVFGIPETLPAPASR